VPAAVAEGPALAVAVLDGEAAADGARLVAGEVEVVAGGAVGDEAHPAARRTVNPASERREAVIAGSDAVVIGSRCGLAGDLSSPAGRTRIARTSDARRAPLS
jgi:hypothetical protein